MSTNENLALEDTFLLYAIIIIMTLFISLILPIWLGKGIFYIIDLVFNINLIRDYGHWVFYWLVGMVVVTILAGVINGVTNDRR